MCQSVSPSGRRTAGGIGARGTTSTCRSLGAGRCVRGCERQPRACHGGRHEWADPGAVAAKSYFETSYDHPFSVGSGVTAAL